MLLKIVYLLVRRVLGLAGLMSRRDLAKDAETPSAEVLSARIRATGYHGANAS